MSKEEWEKGPEIITAEQTSLMNAGREAYEKKLGPRSNPYMDKDGQITDSEKHLWWKRGYFEALAESINRSSKK